MTDIEKTLLNDRQSSDAAVTATIETAVAAAAAMAVAAGKRKMYVYDTLAALRRHKRTFWALTDGRGRKAQNVRL